MHQPGFARAPGWPQLNPDRKITRALRDQLLAFREGAGPDIEILLASEDNTLRVPTSVIVNDNQIYIYDEIEGRLELREIETGISNWEFTAVTRGLSSGERIVTSIDREGVKDGAAAEPE